MTLAPIQVIALDFGPDTEFSGDIVEELDRLYDRGNIRVLDLAILRRTDDGDEVALRASDVTLRDLDEMGEGVKRLFGIAAASDVLRRGVELIQPELLAEVDVGLVEEDLQGYIDALVPGEALVVILLEHTWASRLAEIVRLDGGTLKWQGFLTADLTTTRGAELAAISEAAASIELAEAMRGAAYLDALRSLQALQHIKSALAAETVRLLMAAGLMADEAATEALNILYDAGLIEEAALELADAMVAEAEMEVAEAMAAAEELVDEE